jgi:hypothetical protein
MLRPVILSCPERSVSGRRRNDPAPNPSIHPGSLSLVTGIRGGPASSGARLLKGEERRYKGLAPHGSALLSLGPSLTGVSLASPVPHPADAVKTAHALSGQDRGAGPFKPSQAGQARMSRGSYPPPFAPGPPPPGHHARAERKEPRTPCQRVGPPERGDGGCDSGHLP